VGLLGFNDLLNIKQHPDISVAIDLASGLATKLRTPTPDLRTGYDLCHSLLIRKALFVNQKDVGRIARDAQCQRDFQGTEMPDIILLVDFFMAFIVQPVQKSVISRRDLTKHC
jgi:hypothetical protein